MNAGCPTCRNRQAEVTRWEHDLALAARRSIRSDGATRHMNAVSYAREKLARAREVQATHAAECMDAVS